MCENVCVCVCVCIVDVTLDYTCLGRVKPRRRSIHTIDVLIVVMASSFE